MCIHRHYPELTGSHVLVYFYVLRKLTHTFAQTRLNIKRRGREPLYNWVNPPNHVVHREDQQLDRRDLYCLSTWEKKHQTESARHFQQQIKQPRTKTSENVPQDTLKSDMNWQNQACLSFW